MKVGIEYAWKGVIRGRRKGNYLLRSLSHGSCLLWLQWLRTWLPLPFQPPCC